MFHAWVECGHEIIDFTTHALPVKAAMLDAADGGKTTVKWAPEYLWVPKHECLPLADVAQSFSVGVFAYQREPETEALRLKGDDEAIVNLAHSVLMALKLLQSGQQVQVIGVGAEEGDFSTVEDLQAQALAKGLKLDRTA